MVRQFTVPELKKTSAHHTGHAWKALCLLVLVSAVLCGIFAWSFLRTERTFYSWDEYDYYSRVWKLLVQLQGGDISAFFEKLSHSPSPVFTLPHMALMAALGASRSLYVLVNTALWLPLTGLVCSLVAHRLSVRWNALDSVLTFAVVLCIPAVWRVSFEGFPDTGALVLSGLAFLTYSNAADGYALRMQSRAGNNPEASPNSKPVDFFFKKQNVSTLFRHCLRMALFGLMLGLAAAFRRHNAYMALCLILGCGLHFLWIFWRGGALSWKRFTADCILPWAGCGLAVLVVLRLLGWNVLALIVANPAHNAFSAWRTSSSTVLRTWESDFGLAAFILLAVCLVVAGSCLLREKKSGSFDLLCAFCATGCIWMALWVGYVQFPAVHYSVLLFPLLLGVLIPLACSCLRGAIKAGAVALCLGVMGSGAAFSFFPVTQAALPSAFASTLPEPYLPRVRDDYDAVIAMMRDIETKAREHPGEVYVAASSGSYNYTVFLQAEQTFSSSPSIILETKDVDSEHSIPLPALMQARFLLVARPLQYHMAPERQRLVGLFDEILAPGQLLAPFYDKEAEYMLGSPPVAFTLYRKTREFGYAEALRAGRAMLDFVGSPAMETRCRFWVIGGGFRGPLLSSPAEPGGALLWDLSTRKPAPLEISLLTQLKKGQSARYQHVRIDADNTLIPLGDWQELLEGKNRIQPPNVDIGDKEAQNGYIGYGLRFMWNGTNAPRIKVSL